MKRKRTKRDEHGKKMNRELYKLAFADIGIQWVKLNRGGMNPDLC